MQSAPGLSTAPASAPSFACLATFVGGLVLALFAVGLSGRPNLVDNERRVGAYVLDVLHNGHVMAQRDATGDVISKPPMITWMVALGTLPFGHLNRFSLYLPGALAAAALALVMLRVGTAHFGWVAGFLAAFSYVLSPLGDKVVQTARYDGLFALPVTLTALAAYRGWTTGRGWFWFWLAAAWATMVKGPLGLILGAAGLLAVFWEWRTQRRATAGAGTQAPGNRRAGTWGAHVFGIALFLLICGGWLWLAYREMGQPLFDKLFKRELMQHALKGSDNEGIGVGFWEPTVAFITLYLPWSLVGIVALWRVVRHPSPDAEVRRFERFLFCWFIVGLVIFSLAAHQRSRLVMPILPALALLTGREVKRWPGWLARWLRPKLGRAGHGLCHWLGHWSPQKFMRVATRLAAFVVVYLIFHRNVLLARSSAIQRTHVIQSLAADIRASLGTEFPLTYIDAPFALQFRLNTLRFQVTPARAAELLRGPTPAFVVAGDDEVMDKLRKNLGTNTPLHVLRVLTVKKGPILHVVSNQPRFEWPHEAVYLNGPLRIETREARLLRTRAGEMRFETRGTNALVVVTNEGQSEQPLHVHLTGVGPSASVRQSLAPGQSWRSPGSAGTLPAR